MAMANRVARRRITRRRTRTRTGTGMRKNDNDNENTKNSLVIFYMFPRIPVV